MNGKYQHTMVLGLRSFQIICIGLAVTGGIWSSGDLLMAMIPVGTPVTPLSLLFMLYGVVGTTLLEIIVRVLMRKNDFLSK